MTLIIILYVVAGVWLAIYGLNSLVLTLLYLYHRHEQTGSNQAASLLPPFPIVTVQLPVYREFTQWIDRWAGNAAGSEELPWYYVSDALIGSLDGGRLLFLGGSYPEPVILGFPRTFESVEESAVLGADQ